MADTSVLSRTDSAQPAGLVSVDGRTYPLKSARIEARAEGGVAATTFTQAYGNPYQESLEVFYTLPLPANGAVIGYAIRLGKRIIRGEVRRRAEAREEYRKALVEGRTAALLEQDRADTFTQRLGSLPPGETADIEIEVLQRLAFLPADGQEPARWEYRFPTVIGVRYEGAAGRVPDAGKLDVDRAAGEGTPARLEASLRVADGSADLIRPYAPGKEIDLEDREGSVRIVLREKMKLDRDLVIRWSAAKQDVGVRLVEGRGLHCDDGRYILATLTPPATVQKGIPRDLTILIDASGSMSGFPISRAKVVTEELLRSLDPGDRFEILAFAERVEHLVPGPMETSQKAVQEALKALGRLEAGGATEMTQAIVEALKPLRSDSQRQVILLTDGYIGFEGEVIGVVLRRLAPGARLHAVGIGSAPNRTLTRGAARAGRGIEILVGDNDDARAASHRLLRATVRPVLTDLEVRGSALVAITPERPQDVLAGQPLVLLAEIASRGGWLEVRGKQAGAPGDWAYRLEIPPAEGQGWAAGGDSGALPQTDLPLGALYGREAIEDLELQLEAAGRNGDAAAIDTKIENLGLRHGIASRRTSLIAISEDPTVDPKDPRRRERLAVELPAEVSAEGTGLVRCQMSAFFPAAGDSSLLASMQPCLESLSLRREAEDEIDAGRTETFGGFIRLRAKRARLSVRALEIAGARILRRDAQILILEFEVPEMGFLLPKDRANIHVSFDDGTQSEASVLGRESSPQGPHQAGLTIRLALKLKKHHTWHGRTARLCWTGIVRLPDGKAETVSIDMQITIGEDL